MAKKGKKISTTIFLNKKLKSRLNENGEEEYRIYLKVNYDRKNLKFAPLWKKWYLSYQDNETDYFNGFVTEKEFNKISYYFNNDPDLDIDDDILSSLNVGDTLTINMSFEESLGQELIVYKAVLESMLKLEIENKKEKFTLTGFNARLDQYFTQTLELLDKHISKEILEQLDGKVNTKFFLKLKRKPFLNQKISLLEKKDIYLKLSQDTQQSIIIYDLMIMYLAENFIGQRIFHFFNSRDDLKNDLIEFYSKKRNFKGKAFYIFLEDIDLDNNITEGIGFMISVIEDMIEEFID